MHLALSILQDDATAAEYKDLASELKILIHIGEHKNIVNLLGACSKSGKLCVILEYCLYGDLLSFLRDKKSIFQPSWERKEDSFSSICTYFDLANFTYQIARGMDFLASKKVCSLVVLISVSENLFNLGPIICDLRSDSLQWRHRLSPYV